MARLKQEVPQGAKQGWAAIWTPFVRLYHALFASLRPQSLHAKSSAKDVAAAAVKPVARKTGKTASKQVAPKAKPSTKAKPAAAGKKPAAKKTASNRKSTSDSKPL